MAIDEANPPDARSRAVARRIVWFEPPAEALADPIRFMAYAMLSATHEDMKVLRRHVSDDDFREALDHAPPGIIDPRSWAYWNSKIGRYPAPPLPQRRLDSQTDGTDAVQLAARASHSGKVKRRSSA